MKIILLCLAGLIAACHTIDKKKQEILNDSENNCKRTSQFSYAQLKKKYPLNQSASILLISFVTPEYPNDSLNFPIDVNRVLLNQLKEYKILDTQNTQELADILYNYDFDPEKESVTRGALCYEPVNAIIFLNDKKEMVDYIEVCFSCNEVRYDINKIEFGYFCQGKLDLLKNFFLSNGLKYVELDY